jgi:hypothetical protein
MTSTMMNAALELAQRGLPVFPLNTALPLKDGRFVCSCGSLKCRNSAKHPLAKLAPRGLLDATTDPRRVSEWWLSAPSANIGLATGDVVVVDVDPHHGGDESLRDLEQRHGELPPTWRAFTGGGMHIYFRAPSGIEIRNSAGKFGPGVDVRGVGGYVVAPPSLHASGNRYAWDVDAHPDEVPLAELPDFLQPGAGCSNAAKPASVWREIIARDIPEGSRNDTLTRLAGYLLRRFVDPYVTLELCQLVNVARCRPPLSPEEVQRACKSIANREFARREAAAS